MFGHVCGKIGVRAVAIVKKSFFSDFIHKNLIRFIRFMGDGNSLPSGDPPARLLTIT